MEWKDNIIDSQEGIADSIRNSKTIAVLGIKPADRADQAAYYVPKYMQEHGFRIIPVPVYYPEATEILGEKVFRKIADVPESIDMVNVFRRPQDIDAHIDDIIAAKPAYVWFQLGIRNDSATEKLAKAGIRVIQDACLMVEHRYV